MSEKRKYTEKELSVMTAKKLRHLASRLKLGDAGWRVTAPTDEIIVAILTGKGQTSKGPLRMHPDDLAAMGIVIARTLVAELRREGVTLARTP